ncbi:MAG TPA: hypothetical protein VGG27_06725 [Magnetospirillaceae bacterium]|jgi:hypothetical protein
MSTIVASILGVGPLSPLFNPPPKAAAPPAVPTLGGSGSQNAATTLEAATAGGRNATLLTSGLGDTSTPTIGKMQLLGGP